MTLLTDEASDFAAGPLTGVRVIDLSSSYAAPTASLYLADMGADVIKVEPSRGDDARGWGPPFVGGDAAWFLSVSRRKRSICLDIQSSSGHDALMAMLAHADVALINIVPPKLPAVGLDPNELVKQFPQLVVCVVSGYGLDGPDSSLPGYDLIAQARSGIMSVTGAAGGMPQRVSAPLSDVAAGTVAAFAISSALVKQRQTGVGEVIDVSLLESDLAFMRPRLMSYLAGDSEPKPSGGSDSVVAIYQAFETRDRPIVVAIGNDRHWQRVRKALDLADWTYSPDLDTNVGRRARRSEVVTAVQDSLRGLSSEEALDIFRAASVPAELIYSLSEVALDRQHSHRQAIVERTTVEGHSYFDVSPPWRLKSADRGAGFTPPPAVGADTREVLKGLGHTDQTINTMIEEGSAWAP